MGLTADLLNAQSRPPAEAERITSAIASASDDDASASAQIAAAERAAEAASYAIADEKRPPREPVPAGHTAAFVDDSIDAPTFDDAPEPAAGHRTDPRFLLTDEPTEPEPAHEPTPRADSGGVSASLRGAASRPRPSPGAEVALSPLPGVLPRP